MTEFQGAVGLVQLRKLNAIIEERQRWANFYHERLSSLPWLRLPAAPKTSCHAWQAFVTYVDPAVAPMSRNQIMEHLQGEGIATRPGTHAVHMLGYYREHFGYAEDDFPGARDCERNTMAIPLHNRMSADDYGYVIDCIKKIARGA